MPSFFGIITEVIRLLTFQSRHERIRNDLPRREDQLFGPDVRPSREFRPRRDPAD